jgi:4-hydroxybenzoate polyprenyltransferase
MRPREWIKNLFVFIPILISGSFFNLILFRESFIAFISFCLVSSCVYFFNDIIDIERDRMHNVKKIGLLQVEKYR